MKENLEQELRIEEPIQTFAGVPGLPGPPTYMEIFPSEALNESTKYDSKCAIWNSGDAGNRYKNVSFADSTSGLQFKVDTVSPGYPGYMGSATQANLFVRIKRNNNSTYYPWYKIYHEGNSGLFASIPAIMAKADRAYVDSGLSTKMDKVSIDAKADKTYVDAGLVLKANAVDFDATKADVTYLKTAFPLKADKKSLEDNLALKADKASIYPLLDGKADKELIYADLAGKANHAYVDSHLAPKADKTYVDNGFATKTELELVKCQIENLKLRIVALEGK